VLNLLTAGRGCCGTDTHMGDPTTETAFNIKVRMGFLVFHHVT